MNDKELGKKLYKSSTLWSVKLFMFLVALVLLFGLLNSSYSDPEYLRRSAFKSLSLFEFHYMYPEQIITYFIIVVLPMIYYGLIRGIAFYEKGILINRGLPFLNYILMYKDISYYKIMKSKYLMSVCRNESKSEIVFTISDSDRAVAIMDQNGIKAKFTSDNLLNEMSSHKRLVISVTALSIIVYIIQHYGLVSLLFR
jgi:hypothetical protein